MTDQLTLLTPDVGLSSRSLARRIEDAPSGVKITKGCATTLPYLRRESDPVTAHQLARQMMNDGLDFAAPNWTARRLGDLELMGLARRVGSIEGPFGRPRFLWEAA